MGILNTLAGSVDGAFSLSRYLATAFETNAVVRLREDNTSSQIDFKLNGSDVLVTDDINEDTVSTWLTANSASNAYVVTWYDQSGNTRDYTQAVAGNQPLLIESGINSVPTIQFNRVGAQYLSSVASYELVEANGIFVNLVTRPEESRANESTLWSDPNTSTYYVGVDVSLGSWYHVADVTDVLAAGTPVINTPFILSFARPAGANPQIHTIRENGTEVGSLSLNTDSRAGTHYIGVAPGSSGATHSTSEFMFANASLSSADEGLIDADQGTQYNITIAGNTVITYASGISFTLDAVYPTGQFANGDWYVVAPSGLTINSMTPVETAGRHGFDINPTSTTVQSYDDRAAGTYAASVSLPVVVPVNSSVVKMESRAELVSRPFTLAAEVLTVLATAPAAGSFRPPYFGTSKPITNISDIVTTSLGQLDAALVAGTLATWTFQDVADRYVHPQIDHIEHWPGRDIHPLNNMPDYGADISSDNGACASRFLIDDFDYAGTQSHKDALHNYLQMCIDLKGIIDNGGIFFAEGGHGEGRKMPLLFAGKILNDTAYNTTVTGGTFGENDHIYTSSVTGKALFGIAKAATLDYWTNIDSNSPLPNSGAADVRDPYEYIDGGSFEVGDLVNGSYQACCTISGWMYAATVIHQLDLRTEWAHPEYFEYVDRFVTEGVITSPDPLAPYAGNYDNTDFNYGVTWGGEVGSEITGAGRWVSRHGNIDTYGSVDVFGVDMYQFFTEEAAEAAADTFISKLTNSLTSKLAVKLT